MLRSMSAPGGNFSRIDGAKSVPAKRDFEQAAPCEYTD